MKMNQKITNTIAVILTAFKMILILIALLLCRNLSAQDTFFGKEVERTVDGPVYTTFYFKDGTVETVNTYSNPPTTESIDTITLDRLVDILKPSEPEYSLWLMLLTGVGSVAVLYILVKAIIKPIDK